jgi:hypothetical protein
MNGNCTWVRRGEVSVADVQEIFHYIFRRVRPVNKEKLVVLDAVCDEFSAVIFSLVQADDSLDVPLLENVTVLLWCKARSLSWLASIKRTHKCGELARDDPIYISIINSLVVFILLDIESFEVVPLESYTVLKTLETM